MVDLGCRLKYMGMALVPDLTMRIIIKDRPKNMCPHNEMDVRKGKDTVNVGS